MLSSVLALGAGCSGDGEPTVVGQERVGEQDVSIESEMKVGKRLVTWARKIEKFGSPIVADRPDVVPGRSLAEYSDEELAEALRGRTYFAGHEYVDATPRHDLVAALRAGAGAADVIHPASTGAAPAVRAGARDDAATDQRYEKVVIGTDERTLRDNVSYPNRTIMVMRSNDTFIGSTDASSCTATIINRQTAITAAHCVWDPDTDTWRPPFSWAPGFDNQDANQDPYGQFYSCYSVTVPGGYTSAAGSPIEFDYAVIDFSSTNPSCSAVVVDGTNSFFPGDNVGWMGTWFFGGNAEYTKSARIFGYPGQRTSTCGNGGSALTCNTRLWGHQRTGSGIDTTNSYQVEYTHDTSGGQSGAAYWYDYQGDPTFPVVLAIHKGEQTSSLNWGRRLDNSVWTFVQTYSDDF